MNRKEIWREVKGYEGHYKVSNFGRVKSLKFSSENILISNIDNYGYLNVTLCINKSQKTWMVHKLVAIAFLNHKQCKMKTVVDHRDNDRTNNNAKNLQLISQRENVSKDKTGGSSKYIGVTWEKKYEKWRARIRINGKNTHLGYFADGQEASQAYQNKLKTL